MKKILLLVALILSGCSSIPPQRAEYTNISPLEKGWGRVFIAAGQLTNILNVDLKFRSQTGPVYINNQKVGSTAYREYIAVDLLPGTYEAYWTPEENPENIYSDKKMFVLNAGEVRYFSGDMEPKGIGVYFGALGALSDYAFRGFLNERPFDNKAKLVSYFKFNAPANSNAQAIKINRPDAVIAPANIPTNESISQKLRELQRLKKDGIITEDEFQKKKQQLLEKF